MTVAEVKAQTLATMDIQGQDLSPEDKRTLWDELIEELCDRSEKYDDEEARRRGSAS